ncbi:MAG: GDSL-like protein Lipase/Acylhydrolase [uncultured bacterium]|nr:MAG: GDSL-like protein Lipase/Acylhydrolase [uncultured bacterium]
MYKGGLYLAIGDSITWCNYESGATGDDIYTWKIYNSIKSNYGSIKYINKGIGGQDSNEMVSNKFWSCTFEPHLVTVGIGMNDCANGTISTNTYKTNLETIIDTLKSHKNDVHIILCTPSRTSDAARLPYIDDYRTAMAEVAVSKNVSICHFENAFTQEEVATYTTDGIHPNKAGHTLLYNQLWPIVQTGSWLNNLG